MDDRWLGDPLAAFGHGWEFAAPLVTAEKVPDRVNKLKGSGNAVCPQIPYLIFAAILASEVAERDGDDAGDRAFRRIIDRG